VVSATLQSCDEGSGAGESNNSRQHLSESTGRRHNRGIAVEKAEPPATYTGPLPIEDQPAITKPKCLFSKIVPTSPLNGSTYLLSRFASRGSGSNSSVVFSTTLARLTNAVVSAALNLLKSSAASIVLDVVVRL
jgi:hypothetical protein